MGYTAKHVNFYFNYMPVEVLRVGGSEARKKPRSRSWLVYNEDYDYDCIYIYMMIYVQGLS